MLIGALPPHAYLDPSTDAQTLPSGLGRYGIWLRNGNQSAETSLNQLRIIAHEFAHVIQYNLGESLAGILQEYAQNGYRNSPVEVAARNFAEHVVDSVREGTCK